MNVNLLVCHTRNLVLTVECWVIEACGLDAGSLVLEDTPEQKQARGQEPERGGQPHSDERVIIMR